MLKTASPDDQATSLANEITRGIFYDQPESRNRIFRESIRKNFLVCESEEVLVQEVLKVFGERIWLDLKVRLQEGRSVNRLLKKYLSSLLLGRDGYVFMKQCLRTPRIHFVVEEGEITKSKNINDRACFLGPSWTHVSSAFGRENLRMP